MSAVGGEGEAGGDESVAHEVQVKAAAAGFGREELDIDYGI